MIQRVILYCKLSPDKDVVTGKPSVNSANMSFFDRKNPIKKIQM